MSAPAADSTDTLAALQELELALHGRQLPAEDDDDVGLDEDEDGPQGQLRDLTSLAVWLVSTAKPGNGVEQLLDGNPETYWQSDGPQPHTISAQFVFKVSISEVHIFLNYDKDESYTPAIISVRAGNNAHDLRLVRKSRRLRNPVGWVCIPMGDSAHAVDDESSDESDAESPNTDEMTPEELNAHDERREIRRQRREQRKAQRHLALTAMQQKAVHGVNGSLEMRRDRSVTKAHMLQITIHCNHQNGRDSHVRMLRVLGPQRQVASCTPRLFKSREFQIHQELR